MIKKFRKKPVIIEAIQWNGENLSEIDEFTKNEVKNHESVLIIPTLEGDMYASLNDYIIKGVNGEFYPCKPDIFDKTYEEVTEQPICNMKIQEMIEAIKNGKKVRRKCWSGDKFLYYVPSASYPAMTDIAKSIADKDGKVLYKEYIAIRCKDGDIGFYTPTQCDVLAEDWEVIAK